MSDLTTKKVDFFKDKNFCYVLCGPQGSGKTYLCKYIVSKIAKNYNYIFCFCGSGKAGIAQYDYLDQDYVYGHYEKEVLMHIVEVLEEANKKIKVLLLFDDMFGQLDYRYQQEFYEIIANLRHYNCDLIFMSQYYKQVPKGIRAMIYRTFMFRIMDGDTLTDLATEYGAKDKERQKYLIKSISELPKYCYCLISPRGPLKELFHLGKAGKVKDFKINSKSKKKEKEQKKESELAPEPVPVSEIINDEYVHKCDISHLLEVYRSPY